MPPQLSSSKYQQISEAGGGSGAAQIWRVPKRLFAQEFGIRQYCSRKDRRDNPSLVAFFVPAKPVQMPRLLLSSKDGVVKEGNFTSWFKDPMIVCSKFPAALPKIHTFVTEVQVPILCTADNFVEVFPRAHHRHGRHDCDCQRCAQDSLPERRTQGKGCLDGASSKNREKKRQWEARGGFLHR